MTTNFEARTTGQGEETRNTGPLAVLLVQAIFDHQAQPAGTTTIIDHNGDEASRWEVWSTCNQWGRLVVVVADPVGNITTIGGYA